ncbi:MAG: hypothetical protein HZA16_11255 [Nitrospirae bacterium]|nr:hypothetical protein [Nitrospirota bacterium]
MALIKIGDTVKSRKLTREALLFYLSVAVLLPSYQGFENGTTFHFFKILEPHAYFDYHSRSEIEASHKRVRPHASLYFFPSHRLQRDYFKAGADHVFGAIPDAFLFHATEYSGDNVSSRQSASTYICGHITSGLSPPPTI